MGTPDPFWEELFEGCFVFLEFGECWRILPSGVCWPNHPDGNDSKNILHTDNCDIFEQLNQFFFENLQVIFSD